MVRPQTLGREGRQPWLQPPGDGYRCQLRNGRARSLADSDLDDASTFLDA